MFVFSVPARRNPILSHHFYRQHWLFGTDWETSQMHPQITCRTMPHARGKQLKPALVPSYPPTSNYEKVSLLVFYLFYNSLGDNNKCYIMPKHGSSDGSALDSRPRGPGFKSHWILWDRVSKSKPYCLLWHALRKRAFKILCEKCKYNSHF